MVSARPIFQSLIRLSISSMDGANATVASRTSFSAQSAPGRSLPSTKATSTSTRGKQYRKVSTGRSSKTCMSSSR